jgi:hypothetical protein
MAPTVTPGSAEATKSEAMKFVMGLKAPEAPKPAKPDKADKLKGQKQGEIKGSVTQKN